MRKGVRLREKALRGRSLPDILERAQRAVREGRSRLSVS